MAAQKPDITIPIPIPGLPGAGLPGGQPSIPLPIPGTGSNPLAPIKDVGEFLTKLTDPNLYIRLAEVSWGLVLFGIGVFVIVKGPQRVESTTRTATKVASYTPQGRAATVTRKAQAAGRVAQHREIGKAVGRAQGRQMARPIARKAITS